MTSGTEERARKMRNLHLSMPMVLDDLEASCLVLFCAKARRIEKLNYFHFHATYCCDIPEDKGIDGIRHGLSVRVPCVECLSTVDNIQPRGCKKAGLCDVPITEERKGGSSEFIGLFRLQYYDRGAECSNKTMERSSERNIIIGVAFFYGECTA